MFDKGLPCWLDVEITLRGDVTVPVNRFWAQNSDRDQREKIIQG